MKNIILKALITLLGFGGGALALAHAEETVDTSATTETSVSATAERPNLLKPNLFQKIKTSIGIQKEAKVEIKEARVDARADVKVIREENKTEIKERMEAKKVEVKDLRATLASSTMERKVERKEDQIEKRAEKKEEMVKRAVSNTVLKSIRKLQATLEREEAITAKIEARIEKINAGGGNTTEALRLIAEAKASFGKAKVSLEALKVMLTNSSATVDASGTSTTRVELLTNLRKAVRKVEKYLREGHSLLTKAVASLKSANPRLNATTTTSATINTTE